MSDHEQAADQAERELDKLEHENERLEQHIEDAKNAKEEQYRDPVIPEPIEEGAGDAEDAPETDYPAKD